MGVKPIIFTTLEIMLRNMFTSWGEFVDHLKILLTKLIVVKKKFAFFFKQGYIQPLAYCI